MHIALPERPNPGRHAPADPIFNQNERMILLQHIYLEVGLPPRAAIQAARADLAHSWEDATWEDVP